MNQLTVSCSPHFGSKTKTRNIMLDVIIALAPAVVCSILYFGLQAIIVLLITVASCVAAEYLYNLAASKGKDYKKLGSIKDLSAVVTGIILALNLPASIGGVPAYTAADGTAVAATGVIWYIPVLAGFFAIIIVKMLFGGVGKNVVNPALAGRIFLFVSFSSIMTTWLAPNALETSFVSTISSGATNMGVISSAMSNGTKASIDILNTFLGKIGGSMGETSVLAILLGYGYLVVRKVIDWKGPVIYMASAALFTLILGFFKYLGASTETAFEEFTKILTAGEAFEYTLAAVLPSLLSGGLLFGAVFMATDYATSPNTLVGNIIYFCGCGFFTVVFRLYAGMPEGTSFAILFMNCLVPLIDKYVVPKPFGYVKPAKPVKQEAK